MAANLRSKVKVTGNENVQIVLHEIFSEKGLNYE